MGINLSDIVVLEPRKLEDFSGKVLAIDAFNTLYQFLAIIRQPNGTPLMDRQGRVTSHLSGLIYRLSNFVEAGIKPVLVFDGEPPRLKARTIQSRGEIKRKAEREWREAVEIGDLATARTKALALIKKHGALEGALAELGVDIESKEEVRKIFLFPNVLDRVQIVFRDPEPDRVRQMLCDEFDFSVERINAALEKFGVARGLQKQKSLDGWS